MPGRVCSAPACRPAARVNACSWGLHMGTRRVAAGHVTVTCYVGGVLPPPSGSAGPDPTGWNRLARL